MPRRAQTARKEKYTDPAVASRVTYKFTSKIMYSGKRNLAEAILREALARAEATARRPGLEILEAALRNATPIIEVKPRRVGGATYQVPVEVKPNRGTTLALRWLVNFARARRENSMAERLVAEIMDASNGQGASVKRREDMHKMAEANKAFAHYRW